MNRVVVIGAGLTGLTAAHALVGEGFQVSLYDREFRVGGHIRSEWLRGIPYEPHGPHIFHTSDFEVWKLVTSLVEMMPYRHRSKTELRGEYFSWPLQVDELDRLDEWGRIEHELDHLPSAADGSSFEAWCVSQMGETLYGLFVQDYTFKQWGRPGNQLAASLGHRRVEVRTDGNRELFRDPYQGWPLDGYGALVDVLAADVELMLGQDVTIDDLPDLLPPGTPVVVTAALDDFWHQRHGPLEWRGVRSVSRWFPGVSGFVQPAMLVNRPSLEVPYTRTLEAKWVLGERCATLGSMVIYEYPGASTKQYPVPDVDGRNHLAQQKYLAELAGYERNPLLAAGRLANYCYINMDEAVRQGLDVAAQVQKLCR